MQEPQSFYECEKRYLALPIWKRFLWAFGAIYVPELDGPFEDGE